MNEEDDVSKPTATVAAAQNGWSKMDALVGGTDTMRLQGARFLPKWPAEDDEDYRARRDSTFLFNATGRTLGNFAGKPFKEPITFSDETPSEVLTWAENIDMAGRKLDVFAHEVFTAAIQYGLTHVLTDFPPASGAKTAAEERVSGARPYLVHIKASAVLGWRTETIGGTEKLTQLRFMESVSENAGLFGSVKVDQVRVLEPGRWSTYRKNNKDEWILKDEGLTTRPDIPLVTYYTLRTGFMTAGLPLRDLADLNIEHWQSSSDQRSILHAARVPILALTGVSEADAIVIGSKNAVRLPEGGDVKWVEHTGKAISAGRTDLLDIEGRMRQMGAELQVHGPAQLTATQASLDTVQQQGWLAALALQLEDFLDQAVAGMALWVKLDVTKSHVSVFKDFGIADFDNTAETLLLDAAEAGKVSDQTFFDELKRRGTINGDSDWEEEKKRIASQPKPVAAPAPAPIPAPS